MYAYSACCQICPFCSLKIVSPSHPVNSPSILLSTTAPLPLDELIQVFQKIFNRGLSGVTGDCYDITFKYLSCSACPGGEVPLLPPFQPQGPPSRDRRRACSVANPPSGGLTPRYRPSSSPHFSVRRERRVVSSGCESRSATVAPAGST